MTNRLSPLFFCAVGGSGMMPLALLMKAWGHQVSGSDRGRDQGRTPERFAFLEAQGLKLYPQDGSGVRPERASRLIVSSAVEESVPDVRAAREAGIPIVRRAALLAEVFADASTRVAVAGTSGKSTTTGMIAWILHAAQRAPTVVNGAVMKNFVTPENPYASALVGDPNLFVCEVDESDGSIELYDPNICILNNISLDHKGMDELRGLFSRFIARAKAPQNVIINLDNGEAAQLAGAGMTTFSFSDPKATVYVESIIPAEAGGLRMVVHDREAGERAELLLPLLGRHNAANALAALCAAKRCGVSIQNGAAALQNFSGIARRLERVGTANGITVYDDFAHNPDKIAATFQALHEHEGRIALLFQPHGFGPLKLMKDGFLEVFSRFLRPEDRFFLVDPLYLGGTVDRSVTSGDLAAALVAKGAPVTYEPDRDKAAAAMAAQARAGDRLVIMGARDDTLPALAQRLLTQIAGF